MIADPLIRQQIEELRSKGETAQATILEVLVEVRQQTTLTNGRVTVLEDKVAKQLPGCPGKCDLLEVRLAALEAPAKKISILWGASLSAISGAVVVIGLVFAFLSTPIGEKVFESKEQAIAVAVEKALEAKLQSKP
jgi:hypothetical protein